MMRVAAHKLGPRLVFPSIRHSADNINATCRSARGRRIPAKPLGRLSNRRFIYMALNTLSIFTQPRVQISKMRVFHLNLSPCRENKSCAIHRPLSHICNLRPGNGNPARGENEVSVGSARLSLRAENWRNRSDGISRKHRVLVSFSRNKGSSFLQLCQSLCINLSQWRESMNFPAQGWCLYKRWIF